MPRRKKMYRESDHRKHVVRRAPPQTKHRKKKGDPAKPASKPASRDDDPPVLRAYEPLVGNAEEKDLNWLLCSSPGALPSRDPDAPVTDRERKIVLASPGKTPYIGTPILGEPYPGGD